MTGYPERSINGTPPSWLHQPRPTRGAQLVGACIHATRSGYSDGDDGPRTENWELSQGNGSAAQGWGSSCDLIIFENGLRVKVNPDIEHRDCNYGAGFGQSMFTWSCGWYYEQIEMAQGVITDEYTFAQIDSLAEYLVRRGYPPVRIPFLTQTLGLTPPAGICTHEDSENGKKLGKSDPGPKFPWDLLFRRMAAWSGEEDDMALSPEAQKVMEWYFTPQQYGPNSEGGHYSRVQAPAQLVEEVCRFMDNGFDSGPDKPGSHGGPIYALFRSLQGVIAEGETGEPLDYDKLATAVAAKIGSQLATAVADKIAQRMKE